MIQDENSNPQEVYYDSPIKKGIADDTESDYAPRSDVSQTITDFIERQFRANEKQQKIREEGDRQVQTIHRPFTEAESRRVQELYEMSLKPPKEEDIPEKVEPPKKTLSEKSIQLANAKNERQISVMFLGLGKLNNSQFDNLMRKFSIKQPELIESLKEYSFIEDGLYNGNKIKKLMIAAVNKEDESKLAKKIFPYVTVVLANYTNTVTPKLKHSSISSMKGSQCSKSTSSKATAENNQTTSMNASQKKVNMKSTPKQSRKYLPDFYEHLDLMDVPDNSPRYRTNRNYLAEKPRAVWK